MRASAGGQICIQLQCMPVSLLDTAVSSNLETRYRSASKSTRSRALMIATVLAGRECAPAYCEEWKALLTCPIC